MAEFPRRGSVHWVDFNPTRGSEQSGRRPAVIVSSDALNRHSTVVTVVPATSRLAKKVYPHEVVVDSSVLRGRILCGQLRTISKERLEREMGALTHDELRSVDRALKLALDIR
jgi:mRNA interferase MazF